MRIKNQLTKSLSPAVWNGRRAAGFTLVELLVVIAIIGMITAIAVPTVFSAIRTARNAAVKSELELLHVALMNYKNECGTFPPANMQGLWSGGAVNVRHPVYKHLVRVFPRIKEATSNTSTTKSPYQDLAQMSPAQALVFWLSGFYSNPEYPLTNNGTAAGRKKLFEFNQARLYAASSYDFTGATPQNFVGMNDPTATAFGKQYPVYFTPHPNSGLPYVYFDGRCYDTQPGLATTAGAASTGDLSYSAQSKNGVTSTAFPYISSSPTPNPTWAQLHMCPDTFQLIAAGADGSYGDLVSGAAVQASFPLAGTTTFISTSYSWPTITDIVATPGQADNLTNFADRPLRDASIALQNK